MAGGYLKGLISEIDNSVMFHSNLADILMSPAQRKRRSADFELGDDYGHYNR